MVVREAQTAIPILSDNARLESTEPGTYVEATESVKINWMRR